ncbi:hypothetical protein MIMGU_mgv1a0237661mg, partial [Erythranthe guttata]
ATNFMYIRTLARALNRKGSGPFVRNYAESTPMITWFH